MVSGEGEGEVPAGWGGAAAEAPRPLEKAVFLLTLLVPEVLLILKDLPTSGHNNQLRHLIYALNLGFNWGGADSETCSPEFIVLR